MSVLKPTAFHAEIMWLGRTPAKPSQLASHPETSLFAGFGGVKGEVHSGVNRKSCSRVAPQYPIGTTIRNTRQFSILSAEDLVEIAAVMGIESLSPHLLGATMVVRGIPDFSHVPPGSRIQSESGATLVVDLQNRPCTLPARGIEIAHPGFGAAFKKAAQGRRGIVAWVEREGALSLGDRVRLHIPDQPVWSHLNSARAG